jgi:hypothetical protein
MKIKITEIQAKRLNLISEDIDQVLSFEQFCKTKLAEVNKWYVKIAGISIEEILHNEVNMEKINDYLNKIESDIRTENRKAYNYINNLPEDDLDIRIDRAEDTVLGKLTSLQLITMDLEKLQLSLESNKIKDMFKDVQPIDITDIQK